MESSAQRPRSHTPTNDATTNDSVYSDDVQTSFNELSSSILERLNENYILSFEELKEIAISLSTITNQQAKSQEQNDSELILSSISLLRKTFDEAFKIFDRINEKPQELQHFSPDLYWNSLPLFLKNFIGILMLNDK
ncbi:unnamed protein product, partial [Didymodactylos carnosus]